MSSSEIKNQGGLLMDGPYLKPASAGRLNLYFWLLLWPQYALALYFNGPAIALGQAAIVAGSLVGCLISAPGRLRAFQDLDWLINAWLAGLLTSAAFSPLAADSFIRGLICGLITGRKESARNLMIPGVVALMTLAASFLISRLKWLSLALSGWPIGFQWADFGWAELAALVAAIVLLKSTRPRLKNIISAWLTAGLALAGYHFLETFTPLDLSSKASLTMAARAAAFSLAALLIAPRAAGGRLELWLMGLVMGILYIFIPLPGDPRFFFGVDTAVFWAGLILAVSLGLGRFARPPEPASKADTAAAPRPNLSAQIKCDHWGEAVALGRWLGAPSCRLAAAHDGGPLACPYGCLALGDCLRACPARAISLVNNFPVVDARQCLGCGVCVLACPKGLFTLEDKSSRAFIPCASRAGLKISAEYCPRSCLGCGRCRKACPADAIDRVGPQGAMIVDQELCRAYGEDCGRACLKACPRNVIKPF